MAGLDRGDFDFIGFGVRGYRSFPIDNPGFVGPFGKIHLLTGRNNNGKSSLMDFAIKLLEMLGASGWHQSSNHPFTLQDKPQRLLASESFRISLCFKKSSILNERYLEKICDEESRQGLINLLESNFFTHELEDAWWVDFALPWGLQSGRTFQPKVEIPDELKADINFNLSSVEVELTEHSNNNWKEQLTNIINLLIPWQSLPDTIKVGAIRKTTASGQVVGKGITGGEGLIGDLLDLSNATPEQQYDAGEKWGKFVQFVRVVLNDESADVRVDRNATMIMVKTSDADWLALENLGTGIEELVIIAAVVACNKNKLICIEEPEIHLHPSLQARLMRYLGQDDNGNRFLITTHSPTIINSELASITHITKSNGVSRTREILDIGASRNLLDDIGAHPADILQANYVIWVEGPSDRIYVNSWLSKLAPDLIEGLHYSIMVYGGKLLAACSAGTEECADLIALFRINSHFCVLMDSDRSAPRKKLSATKLRVIRECEKSDCMSWVTDGRTIENYVPVYILAQAIEAVHPRKTYEAELGDQYICPLSFEFNNSSAKPDKIAIAKYVSGLEYEMDHNLQKHVRDLVASIQKANS